MLLGRWIPVVALAELVGFAVPAVVGVATVDSPVAVSFPALLAAGAVEGAVLGAGQAVVLRRCLPALAVRRWVALTAAGATVAYVLGLLPSATAPVTATWPVVLLALLGGLGAVPLLVSIGGAQWLELRRHVDRAGRWVGVTALAWLLGLATFLAVATPLWQPGQAAPVTVVVGVGAGALMALVMATVTGFGLVRLLRRGTIAPPPPGPGASTAHGRAG
jgi:hypothetical protein